MEVEYDLANIPLIYEQEIQLGKDPFRLDLLVIKKQPRLILRDPIGKFFKIFNIFEYKSPEDRLSIEDFYKVQGYGLFYKSQGRKVNEIPIESITLTIVRHTYPRDMIKMLEQSGISVKKVHPGIYYFEGNLCIPVQLVISSQLPAGEYEGLKLLAQGATVKDIVNYAEKAVASNNERIKENAGTVIDICLAANKNLEGVGTMYEGVREVFKDFLAQERQEGRQEGRLEGRKEGRLEGRKEGRLEGHQEGVIQANERVAADMLRENLPLQLIMKISKLSENVIRNLAASLGLAIS